MGWLYGVTITVIAIAAAVFAMQNPQTVSLRFLVWRIEETPLAAAILVSVAVGTVLVGAVGVVQRWILRARIRRLESRLASAEASRVRESGVDREFPGAPPALGQGGRGGPRIEPRPTAPPTSPDAPYAGSGIALAVVLNKHVRRRPLEDPT